MDTNMSPAALFRYMFRPLSLSSLFLYEYLVSVSELHRLFNMNLYNVYTFLLS
jgi:hypothetical protein